MHKALIICNDLYGASGTGLPDLNGPATDAQLLYAALTDQDVGHFSRQNVQVLSNAATSTIQERASQLALTALADDVLLFYFSGHGQASGRKLYLCSSSTKTEHLVATGVSTDTLNEIIQQSKARATVVILDCCYSGLFKGETVPDESWAQGRYALMATSPVGLAADAKNPGEPSPFTKALVEALLHGAKDNDGDGFVELNDIYAYLVEQLSPDSRPRHRFDGFGAVRIARRLAEAEVPDDDSAARAVLDAAVDRDGFLDQVTSIVEISHERLATFRSQLRPDISSAMPHVLSANEFLERAHLMRAGRLTRAGVLMFGQSPKFVTPTAIVECARFDGTGRHDSLDKSEVSGSVPEQILGAYEFVTMHTRLGDAPTEDSAIAQPVYSYPMISVREIIANALVHRDYTVQQTSVHVRLHTDRIEVTSPGSWTASVPSRSREVPIARLRSDSVRRNFTLANAMSWMRLVEGEGAGIARIVEECERLNASEPTVLLADEQVTVTIYPRSAKSSPAAATQEALVAGQGMSVEQLLAGSQIYELPSFQRKFVWGRNEVSRLLADLAESFMRSWHSLQDETAIDRYQTYFLGPVVLYEENEKRFLVDGQQRITTLQLLVIYVHHLLERAGDEADLVTRLGRLIWTPDGASMMIHTDVTPAMLTDLFSNPLAELPVETSDLARTLTARFTEIDEEFPHVIRNKALPYFAEWLLDRVSLVAISTVSRETGVTIFERINNRGVALGPLELLKSYLVGHAPFRRQDQLSARWDIEIDVLAGLGNRICADYLRDLLIAKWIDNPAGPDLPDAGVDPLEWLRVHAESVGLRRPIDYARFIDECVLVFATPYGQLRRMGSIRIDDSVIDEIHEEREVKIPFHMAAILASLHAGDADDQVKAKARMVTAYVGGQLRDLSQDKVDGFADEAATLVWQLITDLRGCADVGAVRRLIDRPSA